MNMNQHTPGPLHANGYGVYTNDGTLVCEVLPPDGTPEQKAQCSADAALYAAAPDMLEALKAALAHLETYRPKGNIRDIFTELNSYENGAIKPIRAAIAKAEGK